MTLLESKYDAPRSADSNRPESLKPAVQGMKSERRKIQIIQAPSCLQAGKNGCQLDRVSRLNSGLGPVPEISLQAFVRERADHPLSLA
jgi:hypothetical protein